MEPNVKTMLNPAASEEETLIKAESEGVCELLQAKACAPVLGRSPAALLPHLNIFIRRQHSSDVVYSGCRL